MRFVIEALVRVDINLMISAPEHEIMKQTICRSNVQNHGVNPRVIEEICAKFNSLLNNVVCVMKGLKNGIPSDCGAIMES
mmetsp:Transcript_19887/g.29757  ORF Transcript_19887/g.29757 Transcript_19887/m.29757 type:complete len:80 (-) Transcript_19887:529-768(-)